MADYEFANIFAGVLLMFIVSALGFVIQGDAALTAQAFVFSFIVIGVPVLVRKFVAYSLDASVKHRVWNVFHYGVKPGMHFKKEVPFGLIIPLFFSLISLGLVKIMTFITYETRALKYRASKRFGFYSYTEMTDWHNGLIGASGIVSVLLVSLIGYLAGFEYLTKLAAFYAFWNMIPVSKLDGTQIFFGSKILYSVLAVITIIFTLYGLVL